MNDKYFKEYYQNHRQHIREQQKAYRDKLNLLYGGNYIYVYIRENESLKQDNIMYIGSTDNLYRRYFAHKNLTTYPGLILYGFKTIKYNMYYLELDKNLTREQLYSIEYYLINKIDTNMVYPLLNYDFKVHKKVENISKKLAELAESIKLEDFKLFNLEEFKAEKQAQQEQAEKQEDEEEQ